jgi:hypothetical protein
MFAAIPQVISQTPQAFVRIPQYRQLAVPDFINMQAVMILSDPSDAVNTSLFGDNFVVDPVKGPLR